MPDVASEHAHTQLAMEHAEGSAAVPPVNIEIIDICPDMAQAGRRSASREGRRCRRAEAAAARRVQRVRRRGRRSRRRRARRGLDASRARQTQGRAACAGPPAAAGASRGHQAPACQRGAPAIFSCPEPAFPDRRPQRAAHGVAVAGEHGASGLQAEVGGLNNQLRAWFLADEPAGRVHSGCSPAPNQVGLCSGRNKGRVGALARVPGATSIPEHDQSRVGVWRRVALRGVAAGLRRPVGPARV